MSVFEEYRGKRKVVIGAGYAGLPLGLALAEAGFETTLYDRDEARVDALMKGQSHVLDVPSHRLRHALDSGALLAVASPTVLTGADVVVVCVPTPLGKTREPDLSCVKDALRQIVLHQRPGLLVVIESTVYPGMTRELAIPQLTRGFELGNDVFVAYAPERLDPGNHNYTLVDTPKVISGATPACLEKVTAFYSKVFRTLVPVSSTDAAEMVKLLENTFRSVNIGLVNELAIAARNLGLDPFEVTRAAATKPFGFMPFSPGPGIGGHCIPVDPLYLNWKLASIQQAAQFISVADAVNSAMPCYVVDRLQRLLDDERSKLAGARILVWGVTYKANVPDTRESPALVVMGELKRRGVDVSYIDPWIPEVVVEGTCYRSLPAETHFGDFDAVVLISDHDSLPKERLCFQAQLVLDTRDALFALRDMAPSVHTL